jgi:hypothetical protein
MTSAVEADLGQLRTLLALFKSMDGTIDSSEAVIERVRFPRSVSGQAAERPLSEAAARC